MTSTYIKLNPTDLTPKRPTVIPAAGRPDAMFPGWGVKF